MSDEDKINWVTVTLDFPPEAEAKLEAIAQAAGLSLKCYCIHTLHEHFMSDASEVENEQWRRQLPVTLRRNGCHAPEGRMH